MGYKLVDELLTLPRGLSPQLEAAMESFTEQNKVRRFYVLSSVGFEVGVRRRGFGFVHSALPRLLKYSLCCVSFCSCTFPYSFCCLYAALCHSQAKAAKVKELTTKAEKGGVKGMAAQNELIILEKGDMTETNRLELTLQVNFGFGI